MYIRITGLLRTTKEVMSNYLICKTEICFRLKRHVFACLNYMHKDGKVKVGQLRIASVVTYSHFAVFFMALMVVIIIVICITSPFSSPTPFSTT